MCIYKKVKNKWLRGVLIALTVPFGLLVTYWLLVYLMAPHYQFSAGRPFSGTYLHNPYQDIDSTQWKQCNFHCHSRKYIGITNGRRNTENAIDSLYQAFGYDYHGISDYMHINTHNSDHPYYIPSYEHGYGFIKKTHQLCLGAEKVLFMDFPFMQSLDMKQHMLNVLHQHTRFAVPAHASFYNGYRVNDMRYLCGYRLLEVGNPYGCALEHWDAALSTGHRVYGIGDDDTHDIKDPNAVGKFFTMVNTGELTAEKIYDALENGRAYTVKYHPHYMEPLEDRMEKMHTEHYHLTRCELIGDSLIVETSAPYIQTADFIGQDGKILKHQENVWEATYTIQPTDTYIRVELMVHNMTFLYLNPITRHDTPTPVDASTAEINWAQTIMYYIVYLIVIGVCIWRLIVRKRSSSC